MNGCAAACAGVQRETGSGSSTPARKSSNASLRSASRPCGPPGPAAAGSVGADPAEIAAGAAEEEEEEPAGGGMPTTCASVV